MKNWKKAVAALTAVFALGLTSGVLADDITITVVDWNTGVASDLQKAACQEYMDSHPGIIIDHQTIPYDDYNTKLNTLIAAGETPDIRLACPSVAGLISLSFCLASRRSPLMEL